MSQSGRFASVVVLSVVSLSAAVGEGCSSDPTSSLGASSTETPPPAATTTTPVVDPIPTELDASPPATDADASDSSAPLQGCAARPGASFCDDFDSADALKPGTTKWDFVESSEQPVATISSTHAVSTPSALLSRIIDATTPGAKFAKTITKSGFTEATWEYDVYLDDIGTTDGFFLDDFQFSDTGGADNFGFRLVLFSNAGAPGTFRVEHNAGAVGGGYVIEPDLPAGTVTLGAWHHLKQNVKFQFGGADAGADAGDGGAGDIVTYSLTVDDAATPVFTKKYPGAPRAAASFARFAGMPFVFNKGSSAGLQIYWDNQIVELR